MNAAVDFSTHVVSAHRNAHRVWIENRMLERSGFVGGASYNRSVSDDGETITLELTENGALTVSQTAAGIPIIEVKNKTVTAIFGGHERVIAEYQYGVVKIKPHHICKLSEERVKRFKDNLRKGTLQEGTFCAGAGMSTLGIHEGFKRNGVSINTAWVLDRDQRFLNIAMGNNPAITANTAVMCSSMEEVDPSRITPVDIFQFSMSCKVHSRASRSKKKRAVAEDHSDSAGLYGIFKVLEPVNPAIIISENVPEAKESASFIMLKAVLEELNYNVYEMVLDNKQSGSFENRRRYWLVAVDKNLPEIAIDEIPHYGRKFETFSEVIKAAPQSEPIIWSYPTEKRLAKIERDLEKGNGFSKMPKLSGKSVSAPCVRAEYTKRGSTDVMVAGEGEAFRPLTPEEHCLLKAAPLTLIKGVNKTLAHFILGQGVDMGQSIGVAELVCRSLTNRSNVVRIRPEVSRESRSIRHGHSNEAKIQPVFNPRPQPVQQALF